MKIKILSVIEVSVVFLLMVFLFRSAHLIPIAVKINRAFDGVLFSEYTALLIVAIPVYFFRCRTHLKTLFSEKLGYQFKIIALGFFPIFMLSVLLAWIDWTQWTGAILISIVEIGLLFWFGWMVKHKQPGWQTMGIFSGLMLFPMVAMASTKPGNVIAAVIYFYLFVALSEEILFRGVIQSRLNSAFGHPKRFFGIHWGWGLIITSVFFGFWHMGGKSNMFTWPHVLWTTFAGMIFGLVREKSESVIAPTILHGIMNYGPQAILFYLFWRR